MGLTWTSNGADSYTVYATSKSDCNWDNFDSCNGVTVPNVTSTYVWTAPENGTAFYFQVRGNHPDSFTTRSNTTAARPNSPAFDKDVNALALGSNGTVYVGGAFSSVGALTGPVAPLDKTTGLASVIPNFPIFPRQHQRCHTRWFGRIFCGGSIRLSFE